MYKMRLEEIVEHIKHEKIVGVRHKAEDSFEMKLSNGKIFELKIKQDQYNEDCWLEAEIENMQEGWL